MKRIRERREREEDSETETRRICSYRRVRRERERKGRGEGREGKENWISRGKQVEYGCQRRREWQCTENEKEIRK